MKDIVRAYVGGFMQLPTRMMRIVIFQNKQYSAILNSHAFPEILDNPTK